MHRFQVKFLKIVFLIFIIFSCSDNSSLNPSGYLRCEYPKPKYRFTKLNCPFRFEYSNHAIINTRKENCWFIIYYPNMKAKIYLTYLSIDNNLKKLIQESQKMVYEHTVRATAIKSESFSYPNRKVYGNFYTFLGESAVNFHFYATDSITSFVEGSVYFYTRPNSDSLAPAIAYIKNDVLKIIKTLNWK